MTSVAAKNGATYAITLALITRHRLAPPSHRRPKHLDRETMLLWIQQRHAAGQSLVWTTVCLENRDHALATRREFYS